MKKVVRLHASQLDEAQFAEKSGKSTRWISGASKYARRRKLSFQQASLSLSEL